MTAPAKPAARPTVLVVDDNIVMRQIYRKALEADGFAVTEADGGARALQIVHQAMPVAIVLDLLMVAGDGFSFLEQLRRRSDGQTVPVVVATAKPVTDAERAVLDALTQRVVRKSKQTAEDVLACVRELLGAPMA